MSLVFSAWILIRAPSRHTHKHTKTETCAGDVDNTCNCHLSRNYVNFPRRMPSTSSAVVLVLEAETALVVLCTASPFNATRSCQLRNREATLGTSPNNYCLPAQCLTCRFHGLAEDRTFPPGAGGPGERKSKPCLKFFRSVEYHIRFSYNE